MEHKFRVWCKNNNEWEKDECFLRANGTLAHRNEKGTLVLLRPDTHIVSMFTGLRDKNGVEIWEGDICRGEYGSVVYEGEVLFVEGVFAIKHNNDEYGYCASLNEHESVEIIGNVWDNPDLLKEES